MGAPAPREQRETEIGVLDDEELDFNFTGTTRFEGLEEAGELVCDPRSLRDGYLRHLSERVEDQSGPNRHELGGIANQHEARRRADQLTQSAHRDDVDHAGFIDDNHAAIIEVLFPPV